MIELGTLCMLLLHIPTSEFWMFIEEDDDDDEVMEDSCEYFASHSRRSSNSCGGEVCFSLWLQFKWQYTIVIDINAAKGKCICFFLYKCIRNTCRSSSSSVSASSSTMVLLVVYTLGAYGVHELFKVDISRFVGMDHWLFTFDTKHR